VLVTDKSSSAARLLNIYVCVHVSLRRYICSVRLWQELIRRQEAKKVKETNVLTVDVNQNAEVELTVEGGARRSSL
jgi:hypothetical protein